MFAAKVGILLVGTGCSESGYVVPGVADGVVFVDEDAVAEGGILNHVGACFGLRMAFVSEDVDISIDVIDEWAPFVIMEVALPIGMLCAIGLAAFAHRVFARDVFEPVPVPYTA